MRLIFLFLVATCLQIEAATVQFTWTNWDASISTNDLVISQVPTNQPINDGTFTIKGLPRRYPTTNGFLSATILTGNYAVVPYGVNIQPVIFAVPNDSQTYDFWQLRISGGNTYNYSPGVQQIVAGSGTSLSPSNGKGIVTVTSTGAGGIGAVAAGANVAVSTNSNLYTVSLPFTPQFASATLSNYSTVGTNYWYPTNNPAGFITSNNVANILGYVTNVVTTNTSSGVTNIITGVIAGTSISKLSDVHISGPVNGQILGYNNGWINEADPSVTQVGLAAPVEFTVSGSPVTSSGTLTLTKANQNANLVYAGPSTGSPAAPTFRALVAADIPPITQTVYGSNIISGGNIAQSVLASNSAANGWFLANSNGFNFWSINAGAFTNLQSANLIGLVPTANEGTGTATSGKFLRGDQLWTNLIQGNFTIANGNFTNSGNSSLDNGALLSDGAGNLTGLKFVGRHAGSGDLLTNLPATNIIGTLPDARLSANIPLLNAVNNWVNNNLFANSVEFDGGIVVPATVQTSFGGNVEVGATASMSSNRFQVVNAQGRYVLEVETNGTIWVGTNHLFFINFNGGVESYLGTNFFAGTIFNSNTFTGNKVVSYDFEGNGAGLTNLNGASISNAFNPLQFQIVSGIVSASNTIPLTNSQLYGQTVLPQAAAFNLGGYIISNDFANGVLDFYKAGFLETMNPSWHTFAIGIASTATSNNFSGIVKAANFSGVFTNTASAGGRVQVSDSNGKIIDSAASGAVPANADGSATTSAQVNTLFPGNIVTNGASFAVTVSNTWTFKDAANNQASITNGVIVGNVSAKTLTNSASSGSAIQYTDANKKLIDATIGSGLSFSGGTLIATGTGGGSDTQAWHTNGNAGVTAASGGFLGTTDANPLILKANANIVAWFAPNTVPAGNGPDIVLGGGSSTVTNQITLSGGTSAGNIIAGGAQNLIQGSGATGDAGIFAGNTLTMQTNCGYTVMLGGNGSIVRSNSSYSFILSGGGCDLGVGPSVSTLNSGILGGLNNTNSGNYSIVLGGARNAVSAQSALAAGNQAKATHQGAFVWADSQSVNFTDAGQDTFNIRATNGIRAQSAFYMTNLSTAGISPDLFITNTTGANQWMKLQAGNLSVGGTISGTLSSIAQSSMVSQYATNIANHFADVGNSSTSDTTLYSDSVPASTLSANGQKLRAKYGLNTVAHATATRQIKVFFGGTSILDTTALATPTTADTVDIEVFIIRDSSTSIRYDCRAMMAGGLATNFVTVGKLTGLTLSSANTIELHGQAGAAGAASNDIVATIGTVNFEP